MSTSEVFKKFYSKLLRTLPMNDDIFVAKLYSRDLLPDDYFDQIQSLPTGAKKAKYFLNDVIKPSVTTGDVSSFDKLLDVMEDNEHQGVKKLAKLIRNSLRKRSNSDNGPDINNLRVKYLRLHKVTQYIRLAIVETEDVTLSDEKLNEVTKLTLQGDVDRILKKKQPLGDLREIFHYKNEPCPRLIVIMGGPGVGKTTLANEICLRWARNPEFLSEDFDAVLLVPIGLVQQQSLKEFMIMQFGEKLYERLEKSAGNRCLIILEGLHKLKAQNDPFLVDLLQNRTIFQEAVLLVTSRPYACAYLATNRRFEILGFTKAMIKTVVSTSFYDTQSAYKFLELLDEFSDLHTLCYIPLILVTILDIFRSSKNRLPSNIYQLLVIDLVQREIHNPNSASSKAADDDRIEALCKQLVGIPRETANTILMLSRLAYRGFTEWSSDKKRKIESGHVINIKEPKLLFTESDLIQCDGNITTEFDGFGLLRILHVDKLPTSTTYKYKFLHTNIQEFLCLLHVSLLPQQDHKNCLSKLFDCNNNFKTWLNFLSPLSERLLIDCYCRKQVQYAKETNLTIKVRHAKIMVCGPAEAGKTKFTCLLKNVKFEDKYESTGVSDTKQIVIEQKNSEKEHDTNTDLIKQKITISGTKWTDLTKKLEYQGVIDRLLSRLRKQNTQQGNELDTEFNEPDSTKVVNDPANNPAYQTNNNQKSVKKQNQTTSEENEYQDDNFSDSDEAMEDKIVDSERNLTSTEYITVHNEVLGGKYEEALEIWDMLTLLDTGGQPELINMLPSVNTSAAVNFIVFDLSIGDDLSNGVSCLKKNVIGKSSKKGYNERTLNYTYLNLLKCLLSFTKMSARKKILYPELPSFDKKCYDKAGVCFIGTHADELMKNLLKSEVMKLQNEEIEINRSDGQNDQDVVDFFSKEFNLLLEDLVKDEVESLNDEKIESLKYVVKKRFNNYVNDVNQEIRVLKDQIEEDETFDIWNAGRKNLFVVDNTTAGEPQDDEHVAESIRSEIFKTVKETWYEIPIAWFILQLQLSYEEDVFVSLDGVKVLVDKIMPEDQQIEKPVIRGILRFFHALGTLMYFGEEVGDFVITNPQQLFDTLTEIVDCTCSDKICNNSVALDAFKDRGILSDDLLDSIEHLPIDKISLNTNANSDNCKKESRKLFLKLLEHLKVIAPTDQSCIGKHNIKGQCYFMPSILPVCKSIDDMSKILPESEFGKPVFLRDSIVEPLLIKFTYGTIPRGFLCFLAVTLLKKQKSWTLYPCKDGDLHQFNDLIKLRVGDIEYLALLDRAFYLELQVRVNHEDIDENSCNICFEIQEAVTSALQDICKDFNSQFTDLRYGFLCRRCRENPEKHLTVLFKDKPISECIPNNHCADCGKQATKLRDKHIIWFKKHLITTDKKSESNTSKSPAVKKLCSDIVKDFSVQLVEILPMDDTIFISILDTHGLFPYNSKEAVLAEKTRSERASYFLDNVITRGIDCDDTYFMKLLCVMEESAVAPLQSLAKEIRCQVAIQKRCKNENIQFITEKELSDSSSSKVKLTDTDREKKSDEKSKGNKRSRSSSREYHKQKKRRRHSCSLSSSATDLEYSSDSSHKHKRSRSRTRHSHHKKHKSKKSSKSKKKHKHKKSSSSRRH